MTHIADATVDMLVQQVRTLVAEIARLRSEVAALRDDVAGVANDHDTEVIGAALAAMGEAVFVAAELHARALHQDAIGAHVRRIVAGRSVVALGKLLAAAAGKRTPGGHTLRRVANGTRDGAVWQVVRG